MSWWTFRKLFLFFFSGAGERRRPRRWLGAGFNKNRGRGGGSEEEAREGEGRRGNVCGEEGRGAKYFISGPKCPPRCFHVKFLHLRGQCANKECSGLELHRTGSKVSENAGVACDPSLSTKCALSRSSKALQRVLLGTLHENDNDKKISGISNHGLVVHHLATCDSIS